MANATSEDDTHHSPSTLDRLVYQANQAAAFFATQKHDEAVAGTADHIAKYWDPAHAQNAVFAHLKAGGAGLDPLALEASVQALAKSQAA